MRKFVGFLAFAFVVSVIAPSFTSAQDAEKKAEKKEMKKKAKKKAEKKEEKK
jgi:preprotein translocase subunit SecG